jgi:hypothetical protein
LRNCYCLGSHVAEVGGATREISEIMYPTVNVNLTSYVSAKLFSDKKKCQEIKEQRSGTQRSPLRRLWRPSRMDG